MGGGINNLIKHKFSQKNLALLTYSKLSLIIISFGILVRLIQYLFNRSLWADEAVLALNIINRSYLELLAPLDYEQGAPYGFLIMEKLAVQLFGNNEYALRLFPLLASVVAFFLLYELANRCVTRIAVPIALALFASLRYLVYYASEVKQYSSDVAIALLCCLIARQLSRAKLTAKQMIFFGVVGAIAIWFSHPAVFVLAGVGAVSLLTSITKDDKSRTSRILVIGSIWLISFSAFYFLTLQNLGSSEALLQSWQRSGAFPKSPFDVVWIFDSLGRLFSDPLGFPVLVDGLAIFAFLAGCISCYQRQRETLFILLSPVLVTLVAGYLYKYPFGDRLVLFLTPFMILLIAEGVAFIWRKTRQEPTVVLSALLLILLLTQPVIKASQLLFTPYLREEIKPVLSYIKSHQQPNDILYVFQRGEYQFKYYAEKYGYQQGDYIIGVDDLDKYDGKDLSVAEVQRYQDDLNKLRGEDRVWVMFSHAHLGSENAMIEAHLNSIGKRIDAFTSKGAFVYLYDLI